MISLYIDIIRYLGISWVISRLALALKKKSGWFKISTPIRNWPSDSLEFKGEFFNSKLPAADTSGIQKRADDILNGYFLFFSKNSFKLGFPPDWSSNPILNQYSQKDNELNYDGDKHWSEINDFNSGDIKGVWEIGRFSWVYPLLQAYQQTKDEKYAKAVWELISDWAYNNPPNRGTHWKCGQEIAIRIFNVITAFFSLKDSKSTGPEEKHLAELIVFESAKRINANIGYALSQKNNHGISEAAGLFTAGVLFRREKWLIKGKALLENQAKELIYRDGSFSQHSTNYHRLMLDVYLWSISIGRANGILFSKEILDNIRSAGLWLLDFFDPISGRTPNLGSNDGALLFPITECDYLYYSPTIQAVGVVIDGKPWIDNGPWDGLACWFEPNQSMDNHIFIKHSDNTFKYHQDGGYALWQNGMNKVIVRCPEKFRHRPAQCDLFHVDVFYEGLNLLRDSGTYSYNCDEPWQSYFRSVSAHNTVQFDGHDQMPEISRFLLGKWPEIYIKVNNSDESHSIEAKFMDWLGCKHSRRIEVYSEKLYVYDRISSFDENAVLRWRLAPELKWKLDDDVCISEICTIRVTADGSIDSLAIVEGWESLYYMEKNVLPVLEVTVSPRCSQLTTEIQFIRNYKGN